jgi:hypothetical protein
MVKEQLTQDKAFLPLEIPAQDGGKSHNEAQRRERSQINFPIVDPSSGPYFLCNSSPLFPSNCKRPQSPCPCKKAEDTCQRLSAVWCNRGVEDSAASRYLGLTDSLRVFCNDEFGRLDGMHMQIL